MSARAPRRLLNSVRSVNSERVASTRSGDYAARSSSGRPMPALPSRASLSSRDSRGGGFRGSSSRSPADIAYWEEQEKSYRDLREERMQASKTLVSPAQQPKVGDIRAIYQDKALVILNKPSGLVSQVDHTLDKADMEKAFTAARKQCSLPSTTTFYPVHRLDRATTGCLLLPTTANLARELSQQFQAKQIQKSYLAVVRGGAGSFSATSGVVDARLFSHDGRVRLGGKGEPGKEARTAWEVLGSSEKVPLSLLRLRPETGVKHQLRVHSAFKLQAPILGDDLHSRSRLPSSIADLASLRNMDRDGLMFLHAHSIAFTRYIPSSESGKASKATLRIAAPMPPVWTALLKEIGIRVEEESKRGGIWLDDEKVEKVEGLHGRWLLH